MWCAESKHNIKINFKKMVPLEFLNFKRLVPIENWIGLFFFFFSFLLGYKKKTNIILKAKSNWATFFEIQ